MRCISFLAKQIERFHFYKTAWLIHTLFMVNRTFRFYYVLVPVSVGKLWNCQFVNGLLNVNKWTVSYCTTFLSQFQFSYMKIGNIILTASRGNTFFQIYSVYINSKRLREVKVDEKCVSHFERVYCKALQKFECSNTIRCDDYFLWLMWRVNLF